MRRASLAVKCVSIVPRGGAGPLSTRFRTHRNGVRFAAGRRFAYWFVPLVYRVRGSPGSTNLNRSATVFALAREVTPSLARMLATCDSTVRSGAGLTNYVYNSAFPPSPRRSIFGAATINDSNAVAFFGPGICRFGW